MYDQSLCNCGDCQEAIKAAERLYRKTRENQCLIWTHAVAVRFLMHCVHEWGLGNPAGIEASKIVEDKLFGCEPELDRTKLLQAVAKEVSEKYHAS